MINKLFKCTFIHYSDIDGHYSDIDGYLMC